MLTQLETGEPPAAPPSARTKARLFELPACLVASTCWSGIGQFPCRGVRVTAMPLEVVVELMRGVEKVLCSWESPFADCLSSAPNCDYLSRTIVPCRGAPITDTAYMGLTSCRWITITGMIAHP